MRQKFSISKVFYSLLLISIVIVTLGASGSAFAEESGKSITLEQNGSIDDERERLKVTFGPSYYLPTGLYVEENQEIIVTLNETDQTVSPRLVISPPVLNQYQEGILDGVELQPGVNKVTAKKDGILYLINQSEKTETPPQLTIGGANILPTFKLGETTLTEWQQMLENYSDAPAFELISSKVMITAELSFAELVQDPEELLNAHDEVVDLEAQVSGLSADDPSPLHRATKFRYHYRQTQESGYWMYAWYNHTAYIADAMQYVLDVEKFIGDGWGPWHELGHVHQQYPWTPGMFTEVTNNIFSLTVQRHFGQPSRLETDNVYETAFQYLDSSNKDFNSLSVWEKLVMFWQLDLAYGEEFYPTFYKLVRETPINDLPDTDEEVIQRIMFWASQAGQQNLIPFFEKWGLNPNDETRQEIVDLGYPELRTEIWRNTDSDHSIEPNDISASLILETLHSFQGDLPEDVYHSQYLHLTAIERYANKGETEKVVKHTKSFKLLLDQQKENKLISERIYYILQKNADLLIEKWQ